MALHKLELEEFYDDCFFLIAIHSRLPDYRLAYIINKYLKLQLRRLDKDLDYKYLASFYSIYEWNDESQYATWNLINNVCQREEDLLQSSGSLFAGKQTTLKTYHLLPELKNVDYLLKFTSDNIQNKQKNTLKVLQEIPQIITCYTVDLEKLKSKEYLIF